MKKTPNQLHQSNYNTDSNLCQVYNPVFIGIDVGLSGGLAMIGEHREEAVVLPVPLVGKEYDIQSICHTLRSYKGTAVFCVIERAQPMRGQGITSSFSFGKGYGIWLAILTGLGLSYQIVHSRVWTRVMLAGAPGVGKDRALHVACRLFPAWQPQKKKDRQLADCLLLAEYARRISQGK